MTEQVLIEQLQQALARFDESLRISPQDNPLAIDATIQRFEFCFELFWKTLQKILFFKEGTIANSPKRVLQEAITLAWITNEKDWLDMLNDRNLTSHTYHQDLAQEIYSHTPKYYQLINKAIQHILQTEK